MDDDSTGGAPPKESDLHSYALSGKVMCFSVVTLLALLFLILCFHFYNRFLSRRSAAQAQPHRLHPSLLKSVPTFNYSSGIRLDCAVCLSEFQEAETGRILPDCRHCFHVECIDTWFRSHSNCPLCRAPVKPPRVQKSGQIVIRIGEYCAGKAGGSDLESAECGCTVTAGVLVPVECGKKSMGVVEEPPWLRSSEPGSGEEGSGTRDPENGALPPRR